MPRVQVTRKEHERFSRARARGQVLADDPSARVRARYLAGRDVIELTFEAGASMRIPRNMIPALERASPSNLRTIIVSPAGDALSWPVLDVDVFVPGLVQRAFGKRLFATGADVMRSRGDAKDGR